VARCGTKHRDVEFATGIGYMFAVGGTSAIISGGNKAWDDVAGVDQSVYQAELVIMVSETRARGNSLIRVRRVWESDGSVG
jgi:hypothetical protein